MEFNSYVPAFRVRKQPTCEELRAMWRLSKREARRATSTNHLPRSRPIYGRIRAFAPYRSFAPRIPSYGSMAFDDRNRKFIAPPQKGSFNKLRVLMGGRSRPGAMSELRQALDAE